ncbi:DUF1878 family protein [Cytobacillus sp. S13-E01]|nr:DUF1878 family protein [Cytobacillus sp. S13-E01]MDF0726908.1 DUF1878 family protein [Cytobacillus sp. S13-E01]
MESLEARIERLEYYQALLFELLDVEKIALYKLIVKAQMTKNEVEEFLSLCDKMNEQYKKQKAEGLIVFTPLLTEFVGMLHPNLDAEETVKSLLTHGIYVPLMNEFKKIMNTIK